MGYQSQAPNMLAVVQSCAAKYPKQFNDCHHPERGDAAYVFNRLVASTLHYQYSAKWGINLKRGGPEESMDACAWREPSSPAGGVDIFDIVAHAGETDPNKPQPAPAWIDQTQATADAGTVGGWLQPPTIDEILDGEDGNPVDPDEGEDGNTGENNGGASGTTEQMLQQVLGNQALLAQQLQAALAGQGQLAAQINDLAARQEVLFENQTKRLFGVLAEEGGTPIGIAEEAVERLYARAAKEPLPAKVNLGSLIGRRDTDPRPAGGDDSEG